MDYALKLADSQKYCREIVQQSGSSFRKSFAFLRADAQQAMHTLYAFARLVDDLADSDTLDQAEATAACQRLHQWLDAPNREDAGFHLGVSGSAWSGFPRLLPSLVDLMERFQLEPKHLHDLVSGAEFDLNPQSEIRTDEDLSRYCHWVASSVGLACIQIWRGDQEVCETAAVQCGLAFQLTNILRDVAEDSRRGRIYLPSEALASFQCSRASWLLQKPDGRWQELMGHYIDQARRHYDQSAVLLKYLPYDGLRMFSLMWESYRSLLDEVERNLESVWVRRIRLPYSKKMKLYIRHAITPVFSRNVSQRGDHG